MAFEIISKRKIADFKLVAAEIKDKSLEMIGQLQSAKAGIQVLSDTWNSKTQRGIIRVGHKYLDQLKSSLLFIKEVNNNEVIVRSIGASGILKKAKENYIQ